jgi:hypothetical protein
LTATTIYESVGVTKESDMEDERLKVPETYTREEREAWDRYLAGVLIPAGSVASSAALADLMLEERRKRFGAR